MAKDRIKELFDAVEEAVIGQLAVEAELVETRNLVYNIMREVRQSPRVAKFWTMIFSVKTLKLVERLENGGYITDGMAKQNGELQ